MELSDLKDTNYIGDGVYVGHDGFHVWLVTHNGYTITNEVALEPAVIEGFVKWLAQLKGRKGPK